MASGIFYGMNGERHVAYIDCLFLCASAMNVTGMATAPVSQLTLGQQILLFILMMLGNLIVNSLAVVLIRRHMFGRAFRNIIKHNVSLQRRLRDLEEQELEELHHDWDRIRGFFHGEHAPRKPSVSVHALDETRTQARTDAHELDDTAPFHGATDTPESNIPPTPAQRPKPTLRRTLIQSKSRGMGDFPSLIDLTSLVYRMGRAWLHGWKYGKRPPQAAADKSDAAQDAPFVFSRLRPERNSRFRNLTAAQRNELGGVEYRALDLLAWLIPIYWVSWVMLSLVVTMPYLASGSAAQYRTYLDEQPGPPRNIQWFWVFQTVSAITNTGLSFSDMSMQKTLSGAYMVLIPTTVLTLIGNTAYPVVLRFLLWVMSKCVARKSQLGESVQFLLDHPRRCFLYLFPKENTWFLFFVIVTLTLLEWLLLMVLDLNRRNDFPSVGTWVFGAFFQSVATRSSGFQTFDILRLAPAIQILQVLMMYLEVYPLTMAVRTTNVYEEQSLGIFETPQETAEPAPEPKSWGGRFLREQIQRQVAYDLWWVGLAIWIVSIAEQGKIQNEERYPYLQIFTIIYELISAYGTVGLSCAPSNVSLSAEFSTISKLMVIAVMFRGRHRGLPGAIDRAIMLPSELLSYESGPDPDKDPDAHASSVRDHPSDTRQRAA